MTQSVSMTQLYRNKQLTGAVPMHSEPSLTTMYSTCIIQQTLNFENKDIPVSGTGSITIGEAFKSGSASIYQCNGIAKIDLIIPTENERNST